MTRRIAVKRADIGKAPAPAREEREGVGGVLGGILGFGKAITTGVKETAGLLQTGGQAFQAGLLALSPKKTFGEEFKKRAGIKVLQRGTPEEQKLSDILTRRGTAEKVGGAIGVAAEFALPFSSAKVRGATKLTTGLLGKFGIAKPTRAISKRVIGEEAVEAVKAGFKAPAIQRGVIKGRVTTETIGREVGEVAKLTREKSIKALERARKTIKGEIAGRVVRKDIKSVFKEAMGDRAFDEGKTVVNKLKSIINKNISAKGDIPLEKIDFVRRRIDKANLFKTGKEAGKFKDSNAVIQAVRNRLNEIAAQGSRQFTQALKASSEDIRFFEKLGKNIVGKDGRVNVNQLQSKVNSMVRAVMDGNAPQGTLNLLKEFADFARKKGIRSDFVNQIDILARSKPLTKTPAVAKEGLFAAIGGIIRDLAAGGARVAGTVVQKGGSLKEAIARRVRK